MTDRRDHVPARREFKYLMNRADVPALRRALESWCDLDKFAGPDRTYRLRSLYFDAPDMRLYHANEREAPQRFKARVRSYPEAESSPVIAEIKFRSGDVIRKTRTRMPQGDWTRGLRAGGGLDLDPFVVRMHRHDLRPVALVDYRREAYMSRVDTYARVSIDSKIQTQAMHELSLEAHAKRWRAVDTPLLTFTSTSPCVVELKWADYAPPWMVQLAQSLDLTRHSFSKYCYSMLSLADDHHRDYREGQSLWG
ncbi:MAG: polyphosphate polymerase domain-containing protein [Proteobacteria bacterium]|nr:polyphosphate polymerase domain-containing protein [Pseudomonadota bacterium]